MFVMNAYSSITALYVECNVSFEQKTLSNGKDLDTLAAVLSMCLLHVSLGSSMKPSILGCVCMSSKVLLICRLSLVLFDLVQVCMLFGLYGCFCSLYIAVCCSNYYVKECLVVEHQV